MHTTPMPGSPEILELAAFARVTLVAINVTPDQRDYALEARARALGFEVDGEAGATLALAMLLSEPFLPHDIAELAALARVTVSRPS